MDSKSHNQNSLQAKSTQSIQTITAYQGLIPPPDMLENFKKIDSMLPERIVKMAEQTIEKSLKELDIHEKTIMFDLENDRIDLNTKHHIVLEDAKYNFRAQIIILSMVIVVLVTAVVFGLLGLSGIAYAVIGGGFATIIIAAIKGVSNKAKGYTLAQIKEALKK
ncbi:MAG: hypothetical protein FWC15_07210 [Fibromonadales bacterium]|nr:hypothetical protein [Fibromonadales bacterium]